MNETKLSRPPRVVHIANTTFFLERLMLGKLCGLRDLGYEVSAIAPGANESEVLQKAGIACYSVPIQREIHLKADYTSYKALRELLGQHRFDIAHTHSAKAGFVGRFAARKQGVLNIVHTVHGLPFYEGQSPLRYRIYRSLERMAQKRCDLLLSQNHEDMEIMLRERLDRPENIRFEGNGIDIAGLQTRFAAASVGALRKQLGLEGKKVVGFFARLEPVKGHEIFLKAWARVRASQPDAICVMAGANLGFADEYGKRLQKLLEQQSEGIRYLGFRKDIEALLQICDVVVLPSQKEGVPRILMEAMVAKKPVVATDVPGTRELVVDEQTGILVAYGDDRALQMALERTLKDTNAARQWGDNGYARVQRYFDEADVVKRLDGFYQELLARNGRDTR